MSRNTPTQTTPFDAAKYIVEPGHAAALLNDAFESGDAGYIARALGTIARSEGMTKLARVSGVNRQALYAALGEGGNPTLETLLKVTSALGMRLRCEMEMAEAA
jgi:probable addiction module antidote protein